jgi:hypothetical protein
MLGISHAMIAPRSASIHFKAGENKKGLIFGNRRPEGRNTRATVVP